MTTESPRKCTVCAKPVSALKGGICEACQDRIRREAMGEQARVSRDADHELSREGIFPKTR